jgi:hypothetical protein
MDSWKLSTLLMLVLFGCSSEQNINWNSEWHGRIYPPEHKAVIDSVSGAKIIFATTNKSNDVNFYFDWNCWFKDQSAMFFTSDRNGEQELFAYIPKTGELICCSPENTPKDYWFATVDFESHDVYMRNDTAIFSWNIQIDFNSDSSNVESVTVKERVVATPPPGTEFFSALSQSADRKYLSVAAKHADNTDRKDILAVDILTGETTLLFTENKKVPVTHIQFSKYNPNLLRFSHDAPKIAGTHRMWVVDRRKPGEARKIHLQEHGELVTHEDWWVNDQLTFCGGYKKEESHVKLVNIHDQKTKIIGAGAWWENAEPYEISKYNWWHASGARDGKWVATDNWHGDIAVIDIRNGHLRLLTKNHRTYGKGVHPHAGWSPDSKSVEFTSHKLGSSDVCIAYLPLDKWDQSFMEN